MHKGEMTTVFLLLAQYGATAVIPIDAVAKDYFPHLSAEKLLRKIGQGEIRLPVVRIEGSNKSANLVSRYQARQEEQIDRLQLTALNDSGHCTRNA